MRPFLIVTGLFGVILVSVALADDGPEKTASQPSLAARVDALTKELEALKPLPKQIAELQDEIQELRIQIGVLAATPVSAPANNIPKNAVPHEFNGSTFYMIPLGGNSPMRARRSDDAKLP
jgi:hypothetical protein